jgi:hypothetical protein
MRLIGALVYKGPADFDCVKYRVYVAGRRKTWVFADPADAEKYAAKNALKVVHASSPKEAS